MRRRRLTLFVCQVILLSGFFSLFYFGIIIKTKRANVHSQTLLFTSSSKPEKSFEESTRQAHLYDNFCRFAWTEPMDSSLQKRLKFPKHSSCEMYNVDLFKRYPATGEFSLKTKNYTGKLDCVAQVLKGGLRPEAHTYLLGKSQTTF
ncbi:unnamed protein product [Caenorhabditis sp. 36 PRJEB53466]|nr:unnamed protein product [Caenorhabditis sp. 36 PRJEB53466]